MQTSPYNIDKSFLKKLSRYSVWMRNLLVLFYLNPSISFPHTITFTISKIQGIFNQIFSKNYTYSQIFLKILVLWAVFMTITLIYWLRKIFNFIQFSQKLYMELFILDFESHSNRDLCKKNAKIFFLPMGILFMIETCYVLHFFGL